jgi:short-subunit dehydrogenase
MIPNNSKKTVAITGSTRGIGYGLALEFLKRGQQVILNGRDEARLANVVKDLEKRGFEVCGVPGDVTNEQTFQSIIECGISRFDKIDIWINNAGIPQSQKHFHELDNGEIESLISVNITGVMIGTKAAVRFFKQQGFGKVFNMEGFGSDGRMMDKLSLYGTSKRAVNYFTKSVSKEVKEQHIQVGILSPGMVRTDFLTNSASAADPAEQERNRKVFDILAEDVEVVTPFLTGRILSSSKQYDRIEYLTMWRLAPKLIKLMFVKH